jgi:hypothetical protein
MKATRRISRHSSFALIQSTHRAMNGESSLFRGEPPGEFQLDSPLNVKLKLFFEFLFHLAPPEERS